jgi:hypothetical protein
MNQPQSQTWNNDLQSGQATEALKQAAEFMSSLFGLEIIVNQDGMRLYSSIRKGAGQVIGVQDVCGKIINDEYIVFQFKVAEASTSFQLPWGMIVEAITRLGPRMTVIKPPVNSNDKTTALWVELRTNPTPMAPIRAANFSRQLEIINDIANRLQAAIPSTDEREAALKKKFKDFKGLVTPILPGPVDTAQKSDLTVAKEIDYFLTASCPVAIFSQHDIVTHYFLELLASLINQKTTRHPLGRLTPGSIRAIELLELIKKTPVVLVIRVEQITFGSVYESNAEITGFLQSLLAINRPCIFVGGSIQIQNLFSGGQIAANSSLSPVLIALPNKVANEDLIDCSLRQAAEFCGGLAAGAQNQIRSAILAHTRHLPNDQFTHILPFIANSSLNLWTAQGSSGLKQELEKNVALLSGKKETVAGMAAQFSAQRPDSIQACFVDKLSHPKQLLDDLKSDIFGQDSVLETVANRLCQEAVSRPSNQPIRLCLVGTSGTGKSQTAMRLAGYLGIPYENIDAGGYSNIQMANTQLFGSGPGFVDSNKTPRLMKIAAYHLGCVLEVSDLDHATREVREQLSEQFLQILQTGQAQSGHGTTFSCASLIIIFTLNLPDGADERLFTPIGFGQPEAGDNLNTLTTELKKMLSPAFLSRMGQAVLFNHLSQRTLAMIMESALEKSLRTAGKNFGIDINQIQISPSLGKNFIKIKNKDAIAFGARPLEDRARELVVNAFLAFIENHNMQLAGTVNLAVKLSPKGERLLLTAY